MARFAFAFWLPVFAGCCCTGFNSPSHVPTEQLANIKTLRLNGAADIDVTVGSEPYTIDTEAAPLADSIISGSDLTINFTVGSGTASLPQLDQIHVADAMGLNLRGVDVKNLSLVKTGLGTITASGKATNVTVDAPGNCTIDLSDLIAENVTVNITGDDTPVEVHATGKLTVNINGNGCVVKQTGGAKVIENITGSSKTVNVAGATETDGDANGEGFRSAPQSSVPNAIGD